MLISLIGSPELNKGLHSWNVSLFYTTRDMGKLDFVSAERYSITPGGA